jgi:hypothetical protein
MPQESSAHPPSPDRTGAASERFGDDQHDDLVLMAYHENVGFLESLSSELIERNAAELARMRDLLASIDPSMIRAKDGTVWESAYRGHYDERLAEVRSLVVGLSAGFDRARAALFRYADEVKRATKRLGAGVAAERKLDRLMSSVAVPVPAAVSPAARQVEPMRRWEDIRDTEGFIDRIAELGMDPDSTRDQVTRAYNEAGDEFARAQSIERAAREVCLAELRRAYGRLPDLHGEFSDAVALIAEVLPLRDAARPGPYPRPPSSDDGFPASNRIVSPTLQWIRDLLATLPTGPGSQHDHKWARCDCYDFTVANKELIDAAAYEFGLPPDLLAAIAWREIGGRPHPLEVLTEVLRRAADGDWGPIITRSLPSSVADSDFELMAAPIRCAAEALGYDPASLSYGQLEEIRSALRDPGQHIFIAAKRLERLKAESGLAEVPAERLTREQCLELADRYSGDPYWNGGAAPSYGHGIMAHLDQARAALR